MYKFSKNSKAQLSTCDQRLQDLFNEVIKYFDCTIDQGYRNEIEQNIAFNDGKSEKKYPNGKHNQYPSIAVDVYPYNSKIKDIDWKDEKTMIYFAGFVMGIAKSMDISIRWGGDWNMDNNASNNNSLNDWGHFELIL